jgi:hypothetical protein
MNLEEEMKALSNASFLLCSLFDKSQVRIENPPSGVFIQNI